MVRIAKKSRKEAAPVDRVVDDWSSKVPISDAELQALEVYLRAELDGILTTDPSIAHDKQNRRKSRD